MSTESKIKIFEKNSNTLLYEFSLGDSELAYQRAKELEQMGIDFDFQHPNVTETLCDTLGLTLDAKEDYHQSVVAEIEDHDGSCCHNKD